MIPPSNLFIVFSNLVFKSYIVLSSILYEWYVPTLVEVNKFLEACFKSHRGTIEKVFITKIKKMKIEIFIFIFLNKIY